MARGRDASPSVQAAASRNVDTAPEPATIHGVVTKGGRPAAGSRLTLTGADGSERATTADGDGAYRFTAVPAGHYDLVAYGESGVSCDAAGCISASWAERVDVTVAAGETVRVDVDGD